jgi:hypothetical protein
MFRARNLCVVVMSGAFQERLDLPEGEPVAGAGGQLWRFGDGTQCKTRSSIRGEGAR